jgi:predicted phosphodiesterase
MRIIIMTDCHANLPALQAALSNIKKTGYDLLIHTGDTIAIGPFPAECVELLMNMPNVRFLKGNHESYFVDGLPHPKPSSMSDGEVEHQHWTHSQLGAEIRATMATWPYSLEIEDSSIKATFIHYPLDESGRDFIPTLIPPIATRWDAAFSSSDSSIIFCGHDHSPFDIEGRRRYINPGALGCSRDGIARYCLLEISPTGFTVQHFKASYDRATVFKALEDRNVPERYFIERFFFGKGT